MSVTAPIDIDLQHESKRAVDDLLIIEQPPETPTAAVARTPRFHLDPVMPFVYLGILSLIAIVTTAAYLAF